MNTEKLPPETPSPEVEIQAKDPSGLDRALRRLTALSALAISPDDPDPVRKIVDLDDKDVEFTFGDALAIHRHVQNLEQLGGEAVLGESAVQEQVQKYVQMGVKAARDAMGLDATERIQGVQVVMGSETALHIGITREVMRLGQPALEIHLPERRQGGHRFLPFTFTISRAYIVRRYDIVPEEAARLLPHQTPYGPCEELPGTRLMKRREGASIDRPRAAHLIGITLGELHAIESGETAVTTADADGLWDLLRQRLREEEAAEAEREAKAQRQTEADAQAVMDQVRALAGVTTLSAANEVAAPIEAPVQPPAARPARAPAPRTPGPGARVERARLDLGLSTEEGARRLSLTREQLVNLESCAFQIDDAYATNLIAKLKKADP